MGCFELRKNEIKNQPNQRLPMETLYPDSTEWEFGLSKRALAMGNESETSKITIMVEEEGLTSRLFE
jgi:hypothetical protein